MEKFYNLIPSRTVRNLCKKTKYKLSPIDCIILVHDCNKISLEKKHSLYNEIMKTMPEPETPDSLHEEFNKKTSVYKALKKHMKLEKKKMLLFLEDSESEVYTAYGYKMNTLNGVIKKINSPTESICNLKKGIFMDFLPTGEIENANIYSECNNLFSLGIDLPVPFKKGDLLYYNRNGLPINYLCVFDSICNDNKLANVYRFEMDLGITLESGSCHTLEYADINKLNKYNTSNVDKKLYILLSDYLKGNITLDTFTNSYLCSIKESELNNLKDNLAENKYIEGFIQKSPEDN